MPGELRLPFSSSHINTLWLLQRGIRKGIGMTETLKTYSYYVRVYEDKYGQWRWRLVSGNNRIVADSGESYVTRRGAENAAARLAGAQIRLLPTKKGE